MTLADFRFVAINKYTMRGVFTLAGRYKMDCWFKWAYRGLASPISE